MHWTFRDILEWIVAKLILLAVLAVLAGYGFQFYKEETTAAASMSGRLVNNGVRPLHVDCRGEAGGQPTVVFEAPLLRTAAIWQPVLETLSARMQVCAYDRAGHGASAPAYEDRSPAALAKDLFDLLGAMRLDGPVILVGAGYGGLVARHVAALLPERVAALVLVDSLTPEQLLAPKSDDLAMIMRRIGRQRWSVEIGIAQFIPPGGLGDLALPEAAPADPVRDGMIRRKTWRTAVVEAKQILPMLESLPAATLPTGTPLVVVVARQAFGGGKHSNAQAQHMAANARLAEGPETRHQIVTDVPAMRLDAAGVAAIVSAVDRAQAMAGKN